MVQVSKLYDWPISEKKNTFWANISLFFVFRGPIFSALWGFEVWWSQWYIVSKLYDEPLLRKTHFGLTASLFFVFREPNSVHSEGSQVWWSQWHKFQSCMMICFWENTFWAKTSLFIVFSVPNSVYPEVFRSDDHSGTNFKAVGWTASEKSTFWAKPSLFFEFSGQTQCTLRVSGVMIMMAQVSKLYDDLFLKNKNTSWAKTSLFIVFRGAKLSAPWDFQVWWSQWYKFQSCMTIHFWEKQQI